MSRMVRLLGGSVFALLVLAVCLGSLAGQAVAADMPVVRQMAVEEAQPGLQPTWRRIISPAVASPLAASLKVEAIGPGDSVETQPGPELIIRRFISPDIASPLTLRSNDRLIEVRGGIACTEGEQYRVRVVVTQSATGAYAEGHTQGWCTGDKQTFTLLAVAHGSRRFAAGAARVEAFAATLSHGTVTDTHSWWRTVLLIRE